MFGFSFFFSFLVIVTPALRRRRARQRVEGHAGCRSQWGVWSFDRAWFAVALGFARFPPLTSVCQVLILYDIACCFCLLLLLLLLLPKIKRAGAAGAERAVRDTRGADHRPSARRRPDYYQGGWWALRASAMAVFLLFSCRAAGMGNLINSGGWWVGFSQETKSGPKRGFPRVFACFAEQSRQKNSSVRRLST